MFYILYGEDDFSQKDFLAGIKKEMGDEGMLSTNTSLLQGDQLALQQLTAVCDTLPFLAPGRLVIVEGLLGRFETKRGGPREKGRPRSKALLDEWRALARYVTTMPQSTTLVLMDAKIEKSNPLLNVLSSSAKVREFRPLPQQELYAWIRSRVAKVGSSISDAAMTQLAGLVGGNLWSLSNELEKLTIYAAGRAIDEGDVQALVPDARETSVFRLVDAILSRQTVAASRALHALENEGAEPPYLLHMITRQFRLVLTAKDLLRQRRTTPDIGRTLGLSTFAVGKTMAQARERSSEQLHRIYRKLLETDLSIKTGRFKGDTGGDLALEVLVGDLCRSLSD